MTSSPAAAPPTVYHPISTFEKAVRRRYEKTDDTTTTASEVYTRQKQHKNEHGKQSKGQNSPPPSTPSVIVPVWLPNDIKTTQVAQSSHKNANNSSVKNKLVKHETILNL